MADKLSLAEDFRYNKKPEIKAGGIFCSGLAKKYPELRVMFDSYVLPIVLVETNDIELIEEMFSRLNEAVPHNGAEKRNAIGGPMTSIINEISMHKFFRENVRFTNKRLQHKEAAFRLLFLEALVPEGRVVDTKKVYLDRFVREFKEGPDRDAKPFKNKVKEILNLMANVFDKKNELLRSQSSVPICYLIFSNAYKAGVLKLATKDAFIKFRASVMNNRNLAESDLTKADYDLLEYDRLSIQGTNDSASIRERVRILCKYLGIPQVLFSYYGS